MPVPADGNDSITCTLQKPLDACAINEQDQQMTCHHPKCNHHSVIENQEDDDSFSTSSCSSSSITSSCCPTKESNTQLKRQSLGKKLLNYRRDGDVWVDISNARVPSSRLGSLYPGSRFKGKQQCDTSTYDVSVDILASISIQALQRMVKINIIHAARGP